MNTARCAPLPIPADYLRINLRAWEWCRLPYPDHPKGCPNYGHKATCPPDAPYIWEFFDLEKPLWLLAIRFDLQAHVRHMLSAHPRLSDRQARCVLYWQPGVRKELGDWAEAFVKLNNLSAHTPCPEAMGVNVIATAQMCGLPIRTKPTDTVYKITFAGTRKTDG